MSNLKKSINGVQTRVVFSGGDHYPQFSTDGLYWFPLECHWQASNKEAIEACEVFQAVADDLPEQGDVVWSSKK